MSTSHKQIQHTITNSPLQRGSEEPISPCERRTGREFWSWDPCKMVLMRANKETEVDTSICYKTPANPQVTLDIEVEPSSEPPSTPVLQYVPVFLGPSTSNMSTPEATFGTSCFESSNSIYHSTFSSFDGDGPVTPSGAFEFDPVIGLGISGPRFTPKDEHGFFRRGTGIIPIHSSTPLPNRGVVSVTPPPSRTFLNEIFHTFNSQPHELDTSQLSELQTYSPSLDLPSRKVTLARNLSAPTISSSLKQASTSRTRSNTLPIWR